MAKKDGGEESDLDRMALEEIMKETKRGKERAETMGPMGWIKCPLIPTNKRFFRNVVMGTLTDHRRSNRIKERKHHREISQDGNGLGSTSSSQRPLQDEGVKRITKVKYEPTRKSYSSTKYSTKATSSVQKISKDKRSQSTKDSIAGMRSHRSKNHNNEKLHERNLSTKHKLLGEHENRNEQHKRNRRE